MIITVWIKDLTIKVAYGNGSNLQIKKCKSKEELDIAWNKVQALCHELGSEIKLK